MAGIRVIQLQEIQPASPLHRPWIKTRHLGDIVARIDAALAKTPRLSSNRAIPPAPITVAAEPSSSAALSSTDGAEALRLTVHNSRRCDHAPELPALFFLRRVPLDRWKGNWLIGITWIGNDELDLRVTNHKAIRSGDRAIFAMVSSHATGR